MSEYQYYEFQALDRPLTPAEQKAVSRLSSRVDPHPTRAVFVYNYRDFPGSAEETLARYYDALFYIANWGSVQLAFRFPKSLLDVTQIAPYCVEDYLRCEEVDDYLLLSFERHDDPPDEWVEGEGYLAGFIPLRQAILSGDYRVLYLAWLLGATDEYALEDDAPEPPVPDGLQSLTAPLESFKDLFGGDDHMLRVAAAGSRPLKKTPTPDLAQAIAALSPQEQQEWLLRLAQGEANLSLQFNRRLPLSRPASQRAAARTVGELREKAEAIRQEETARRRAAAAAKRAQEMEALAQQADAIWRSIHQLIEQKQARAYDEAVTQIRKLQQLAAYQGKTDEFQARINGLYTQYSRRPGFTDRLRNAMSK